MSVRATNLSNFLRIKTIRPDVLRSIINQAENSSPGPDSIKYSELGELGDDDLKELSEMLNSSLASYEVSYDP